MKVNLAYKPPAVSLPNTMGPRKQVTRPDPVQHVYPTYKTGDGDVAFAHRPGSMDYLKFPSLVNGQREPYILGVIHK